MARLRAHPTLQRLDDAKLAAILRTGATLEQVEQAALWAEGASDVVGKARAPLSGVVARVYEILTADQALEEE